MVFDFFQKRYLQFCAIDPTRANPEFKESLLSLKQVCSHIGLAFLISSILDNTVLTYCNIEYLRLTVPPVQCAERTLYHWDGVRIALPPSVTHRICSAPLSSPTSPSAPESDAPAADVSAAAPLVVPVQQTATATATSTSAAESPVSTGYTVRNLSEPLVSFLYSFAHGT